MTLLCLFEKTRASSQSLQSKGETEKQQNDAEMALRASKVIIEMFPLLLLILCHRQTA